MEDWEKELDAKVEARRKKGDLLPLEKISKKYDVAFTIWEDYHYGDSEDLMYLLNHMGYHYTEEVGFVDGSKDLGKGYLFVYSKKKISQKLIKKIEYHLGLDLKREYNVDGWWV